MSGVAAIVFGFLVVTWCSWSSGGGMAEFCGFRGLDRAVLEGLRWKDRRNA